MLVAKHKFWRFVIFFRTTIQKSHGIKPNCSSETLVRTLPPPWMPERRWYKRITLKLSLWKIASSRLQPLGLRQAVCFIRSWMFLLGFKILCHKGQSKNTHLTRHHRGFSRMADHHSGQTLLPLIGKKTSKIIWLLLTGLLILFVITSNYKSLI